ncbi:MAG TPA: hypothetical protein VG346_06640 [Acidimicrobiales bacterium]|nr:hypothetical protein [Acidimicrobiales bacterium]
MIVLLEQDGDLALRHAGWRERLVVRLRAGALDAALAAGASPESDVALALHAEHLCAPSQRRLLSRSLRHVVARAEAPAGRLRPVPLNRAAVRRVRAQLESLADRLASDDPVDVRGIARLRALLSDGTGPLYQPREGGHLELEVAALRSALAPDR